MNSSHTYCFCLKQWLRRQGSPFLRQTSPLCMCSGQTGVCGNIRERALGVSEAELILSSGGTDVTDRVDKCSQLWMGLICEKGAETRVEITD